MKELKGRKWKRAKKIVNRNKRKKELNESIKWTDREEWEGKKWSKKVREMNKRNRKTKGTKDKDWKNGERNSILKSKLKGK